MLPCVHVASCLRCMSTYGPRLVMLQGKLSFSFSTPIHCYSFCPTMFLEMLLLTSWLCHAVQIDGPDCINQQQRRWPCESYHPNRCQSSCQMIPLSGLMAMSVGGWTCAGKVAVSHSSFKLYPLPPPPFPGVCIPATAPSMTGGPLCRSWNDGLGPPCASGQHMGIPSHVVCGGRSVVGPGWDPPGHSCQCRLWLHPCKCRGLVVHLHLLPAHPLAACHSLRPRHSCGPHGLALGPLRLWPHAQL